MKILFAADGSECSGEAAHYISQFRLSSHDEIIVLHVISEMPFDDDYRANIKRIIKKVAPRILHDAATSLKPTKAAVSLEEKEGDPALAVIEAAAEQDVDLIVVGSRGIKGIASRFLGSVARSVVINSLKPVLITKPHPRISVPMNILFVTDGSASSEATAAQLASIPFPSAEVVIMHVVTSALSDIPERYVMEVDDKIKDYVAAARSQEYAHAEEIMEKTRTVLSKSFQKIVTLTRMGDPTEEILHEAATVKPDLIAVGSRGLKGIKGMLGSVSRRVLEHAACPVLIGKVSSGE